MKIVADIGATNSRWLIVDGGTLRRVDGEGYNPFTHERTTWHSILSSLAINPLAPVEAYLYGAGFVPGMHDAIRADAQAAWPNAKTVFLASDMLGACHAMAGDNEALVIIMGTGANSCHYDGQKIVKNIEPMGLVLGGEGSGFSIGKALVRAFIRDKMPSALHKAFQDTYNLSPMDIVMRAHQPKANQFLGQFAKFARQHLDHPYMRDLVTKCLSDLFAVMADYHAVQLPHYFTGSIAVHFESILRELCRTNGITQYHIVPDILDGLGAYHGVGKPV